MQRYSLLGVRTCAGSSVVSSASMAWLLTAMQRSLIRQARVEGGRFEARSPKIPPALATRPPLPPLCVGRWATRARPPWRTRWRTRLVRRRPRRRA
jgi:hypothetical protein